MVIDRLICSINCLKNTTIKESRSEYCRRSKTNITKEVNKSINISIDNKLIFNKTEYILNKEKINYLTFANLI